MDQRIVNTTFSDKKITCLVCSCDDSNHLIYFKCLFFAEEGAGESSYVCQECCQRDFLKDNIDQTISAKLGRPVDKSFINEKCRRCGLNSACQNQTLAEKLESGTQGESNGQSEEFHKKR